MRDPCWAHHLQDRLTPNALNVFQIGRAGTCCAIMTRNGQSRFVDKESTSVTAPSSSDSSENTENRFPCRRLLRGTADSDEELETESARVKSNLRTPTPLGTCVGVWVFWFTCHDISEDQKKRPKINENFGWPPKNGQNSTW